MTDPLLKVRRAMEKHLLGMETPAFDTALENQAHTPPAVTVPYQRANLLPATPDNQEQGRSSYREHGVFQVTLLYQFGKGSKDSSARAGLVRDRFKRGMSIVEDGLTVTVTHTPAIAGGFQDGDRWATPVSIRWQAQVAT